jgi:hypothetical protein
MMSLVLTSIAAMGSAFVGNKIYPIKGGAEVPTPPKEADAENKEKAVESAPELPALEDSKSTNMTVNDLRNTIKTEFGMDDEFAQNVMDFIQTPVNDWQKIAPSLSALRIKFRQTLTHDNVNKCPEKLLNVCKLVSIKYSNMKDFIEGGNYTPYGDQTSDAISLLSSTE